MRHAQHVPVPERIARLPKSEAGYPLPFFAGKVNGKPDPRVASAHKQMVCARQRRCWVCGDHLVASEGFAFIGGPISAESKVFGDGPMHLECAEFSLQVCPHLAIPAHKRADEKLLDGAVTPEGMSLEKPASHFLLRGRAFRFDPIRGFFFLDQVFARTEWREGRVVSSHHIINP